MTLWIKTGAVTLTAVLAASVFFAWRAELRDRAVLQQQLKAAQQSLGDATARQNSRDAALKGVLAQLKQKKAQVQKPEQVIAALPEVLPLPQAITLGSTPKEGTNSTPSADVAAGSGRPSQSRSFARNSATAEFPAADLKPLYDFAVDCKSCQAQLAAAQGDLQDEKAKEQALSRERDAALRAAKGGSVLRRVARAAKWFALGAAAGAIAVKAAR